LLVGLALSAFFSGSETGFYRVTRVRLVIDAVDGDRISRGLLALTNFPALFVATTMVGNNLANYMVSLGVVLLTKELTSSHADATELVATILFSPLVFVYGELLPKYLFYNAPNLLLRRCAPALLAFTLACLHRFPHWCGSSVCCCKLWWARRRCASNRPWRARN
jgi:putative hemolysin